MKYTPGDIGAFPTVRKSKMKANNEDKARLVIITAMVPRIDLDFPKKRQRTRGVKSMADTTTSPSPNSAPTAPCHGAMMVRREKMNLHGQSKKMTNPLNNTLGFLLIREAIFAVARWTCKDRVGRVHSSALIKNQLWLPFCEHRCWLCRHWLLQQLFL